MALAELESLPSRADKPTQRRLPFGRVAQSQQHQQQQQLLSGSGWPR